MWSVYVLPARKACRLFFRSLFRLSDYTVSSLFCRCAIPYSVHFLLLSGLLSSALIIGLFTDFVMGRAVWRDVSFDVDARIRLRRERMQAFALATQPHARAAVTPIKQRLRRHCYSVPILCCTLGSITCYVSNACYTRHARAATTPVLQPLRRHLLQCPSTLLYTRSIMCYVANATPSPPRAPPPPFALIAAVVQHVDLELCR